ncbi:MAG: hypothetical protein II748_07645, partial [Clostridia bacterium]|nr:hypothetical protein [Clostridia bacterium]
SHMGSNPIRPARPAGRFFEIRRPQSTAPLRKTSLLFWGSVLLLANNQKTCISRGGAAIRKIIFLLKTVSVFDILFV